MPHFFKNSSNAARSGLGGGSPSLGAFTLGALVGDPACALDEELTLEINLISTQVLAEIAKGFEVQRFIFASTCSVYGNSDQLLDERSITKPLSLYARTKLESEKVLLALEDKSFAPIILRFATVYGLSPRPRFDLVINLLAAKAVQERMITIYGGNQWRPFIHVNDAAEAIIKCIEAPLESVKGQIFNAGPNEQNYQIQQLGEFIQQAVPEVQVIYKPEAIDPRSYRVSFDKIQRYLNFTPHYTVMDGILEIKHAIEQGHIRNYQDKKYNNYKTLSEDGGIQHLKSTHPEFFVN